VIGSPRKIGRYTFGWGYFFVKLFRRSANSAIWHADCSIADMADENYLLLLLQIVCLLMFSCSVVVLTQHPEWFGA
jgi:hypothetical protein